MNNKPQENYSDEQLIDMIRKSGDARDGALYFIFKNWSNGAKVILKSTKNANKADTDDAIQEAIIVLDNSIRRGKYQKKGPLKDYFIGICKGRIFSNRRSIKRMEWTDEDWKVDGKETLNPETFMLNAEQKEIIEKKLNQLDETCKELIKLYIRRYKWKEVAEKLNLGNDVNARQRFLKCRKHLRKLAMDDPSFGNYFND